MRNRLITVFNALKDVETKGDSTLIVADCLRELVSIINSIPEEVKDEAEE